MCIRPWLGRYTQTAGELESVLHVRQVDNQWWPVVDWRIGPLSFQCPVVDVEYADDIAARVNEAKMLMGGRPGGSFHIDEFRHILVPDQDVGPEVCLAGTFYGNLLFEDPFDETTLVDLSDDAGLALGDVWPYPCVGGRYRLRLDDRIVYEGRAPSGGGLEYPDEQDEDLILRIRALYPEGAVRLIVNMHGIVIAKRPLVGDRLVAQEVEPLYVGRIDYDYWFDPEPEDYDPFDDDTLDEDDFEESLDW